MFHAFRVPTPKKPLQEPEAETLSITPEAELIPRAKEAALFEQLMERLPTLSPKEEAILVLLQEITRITDLKLTVEQLQHKQTLITQLALHHPYDCQLALFKYGVLHCNDTNALTPERMHSIINLNLSEQWQKLGWDTGRPHEKNGFYKKLAQRRSTPEQASYRLQQSEKSLRETFRIMEGPIALAGFLIEHNAERDAYNAQLQQPWQRLRRRLEKLQPYKTSRIGVAAIEDALTEIQKTRESLQKHTNDLSTITFATMQAYNRVIYQQNAIIAKALSVYLAAAESKLLTPKQEEPLRRLIAEQFPQASNSDGTSTSLVAALRQLINKLTEPKMETALVDVFRVYEQAKNAVDQLESSPPPPRMH